MAQNMTLNVTNLIYVTFAMGAVTFLPRLSAMVIFRDFRPNPFWKRFFNYIPYAMLSVLIFPDVLSACGTPMASLVGTVVAIGLALMKKSATVVVLGAVVGVYLYQWLILLSY